MKRGNFEQDFTGFGPPILQIIFKYSILLFHQLPILETIIDFDCDQLTTIFLRFHIIVFRVVILKDAMQ